MSRSTVACAQSRIEWWAPDGCRRRLVVARLQFRPWVRDTVNKYGRYADKTKTITLGDLIKFHGHFCGGLVESAGALRIAFDSLFPDGVVDRTDLAHRLQQLGLRWRRGRLPDRRTHALRLPRPRPEAHRERVRRAAGLDRQDGPRAGPARRPIRPMCACRCARSSPATSSLRTSICSRSCNGIMPRRSSPGPLSETFALLDSAGYVWPERALQGLRHAQGQRLQGGACQVNGQHNTAKEKIQ